MRKSATLFALMTVFSALALAESFNGRLIDASCMQQNKSADACDPSGSTTSFALVVSDKTYNLDADGNAKAAEALKNRADRSTDPATPANSHVMAKITGSKEGEGALKVEKVEIQ